MISWLFPKRLGCRLLEEVSEGIIAINPQGKIVRVNRAALQLFDFSAWELNGKPIEAILPRWKEECPALLDLPHNIELDSIFQGMHELTGLQSGRRIFPVWITASRITVRKSVFIVLRARDLLSQKLLLENNEKIIGQLSLSQNAALNIMEDLDSKRRELEQSNEWLNTEIERRVEVERELAQHREHLQNEVVERTNALFDSQEKLRHSERLASIGALAAGVAHEINNPIGAITLTAQNAVDMSSDLNSVEELKELVNRVCGKILNNSRRCGLIVKGILQFARKQATIKSPNDVKLIALSAIELLRESIDVKRIEIFTDFEPNLPQIEANPTELEQVFLNLLKNAVDVLSGGGRISLKVRSLPEQIVIKISDNGPGIPADQLNFIFDPFHTTHQNEGGTGLGLSIVHGIITDHKGTISVESKVGFGTTFLIELPQYQAGITGREKPNQLT